MSAGSNEEPTLDALRAKHTTQLQRGDKKKKNVDETIEPCLPDQSTTASWCSCCSLPLPSGQHLLGW